MDDAVCKRLMTHVEKCVRPVRASNTRKDRMRRELLAHLTEVYEHESTRVEDPAEAAAHATNRFGDPATIREELQDSVSTAERFLCRPIAPALQNRFARKPGETPWQNTLRCGATGAFVCFSSFMLATPLPALASYTAGKPVDANLLRKCGLLLFVAFACAVAVFIAQLVNYWKLSAAVDHGRFSTKSLAITLAGALSCTGFLAIVLAACNWSSRVTVFDPTNPWLVCGAFLGSAIVFEFVSQLAVADHVRSEQWESLDIEAA